MIKALGQNKYRLIVNVGSRDHRKRYTKTIEHKGGKKALQKIYDEFEAECRKNPSADITIEDLLNGYINYGRVLGRKATTIRGYEVAARRLYPLLGEILARSLTTAQLEEKIALMSSNGLSAKTIKNTVSLLSSAYEHAILIGQLRANPCKRVTLPKGRPRDIRILYRDEIQDFLFAIADAPFDDKVAYELALFLGLRRSEIVGLRESDVDIATGIISIHNTRHRVDGKDVEQDTKTKRSTRVLALPDILILDIARLIDTHRQYPYEKVDFLIQDGFGEAINPQTLGTRLGRLEEEKGLPHVTLHGLRHTYASLLHSEGVDMAQISAELGHSNLTTTSNLYTHIFKSASQSSRGIASVVNSFQKECATNVPQTDK